MEPPDKNTNYCYFFLLLKQKKFMGRVIRLLTDEKAQHYANGAWKGWKEN